jgi:oligopeptide/dipeptide ABC transporter ATP-binding protein
LRKGLGIAVQQDQRLLEVKNLKTYFNLDEGEVRAVDDVSFELKRGVVLGVVGESGCGKSVLARSIMRIVRPPGHLVNGQIMYHRYSENGTSPDTIDLAQLPSDGPEMREIRGGDIAMIFQEPMVSFSPVHTIGSQITEGITLHQNVSKEEARERAVEMLRIVGIPDPAHRIDTYPFNLSGGMRQRAMIAMALSCNPRLLIADEPTTALDVTTQAQILELLAQLQQEFGMAMMLITHNMGVVAQMADEIVVMYLGKVVEHADTQTLFRDPKHPYTQELLKSIPVLRRKRQSERLAAIQGNVPPPYVRPSGCHFHPRCPMFIQGVCNVIEPGLTSVGKAHIASCHLHTEVGRTQNTEGDYDKRTTGLRSTRS